MASNSTRQPETQMLINDDLLKEFEETWPYIPDMNVWPKQLRYQYKLFLLEKGHYGIADQIHFMPTENQKGTSESTDAGVQDSGSSGV